VRRVTKKILEWVMRAEVEPHARQLADDHGADLDQFELYGFTGRLSQLRAGERQAAQGLAVPNPSARSAAAARHMWRWMLALFPASGAAMAGVIDVVENYVLTDAVRGRQISLKIYYPEPAHYRIEPSKNSQAILNLLLVAMNKGPEARVVCLMPTFVAGGSIGRPKGEA
jgi:hypothetical protein